MNARDWNWKNILAGVAVIAFAAFWIYSDFLTKPFIWSDESLNIQMARTLAETGKIGIPLSPGVFSSHLHYYTSSSGWVMLASVAAGLKIGGMSFFAARSVMAIYMLAAVILVYICVLRFRDWKTATVSALLVASFASFIGYGKSVLGEVPGICWLLAGLLALQYAKKWPWAYFVGGLGFGLFLATKPAFLLIGGPPLLFVIAIEYLKKRMDIKQVAIFLIAILIAVLPSIYIGSIHPITMENIQKTALYYSNNYNSPCIRCDIQRNLWSLVSQTTFWHLELLAAVTGVWLVTVAKSVRMDWRMRWFLLFSLLSMAYFLKSPGTNRYFFPLQFGLLILFPIALMDIVSHYAPKMKKGVLPISLLLVMVQSIQYAYLSDVYPNSGPPELERFLKEEVLPKPGLIGVINAPAAGAIVPADRQFQFIRNSAFGRTDGVNILTKNEEMWPETIVYGISRNLPEDVDPYLDRIRAVYAQRREIGSFVILSKE